ncbi:cyclic nucleotide-binding/CBS domain-containing protein [Thermodesulfobacteriota bacterium]
MGFNDEISSVVNWNAPSVDINDSLRDVIKKMVENRTSALTVTVDGTVAGVVTEMDVMMCTDEGLDLDETKASRLMTSCEIIGSSGAKSPCVQLDAEQSAEMALGVMNRAGVHHLMVTGENDKVTGMVSILDLLKLVIS